MVGIQTVSIVVASAGVFVAAIYYILQLRHQTRMRKTDLLTRLYSTMASKDWLEAWDKVDSLKTDDLVKMLAEHRTAEMNQVGSLFDEIGNLLQMKLVDIDLAEKMFHGHVIRIWEKLKPVIEAGRKRRNDPKILEGFEYLYNEMKKREQQLASKEA